MTGVQGVGAGGGGGGDSVLCSYDALGKIGTQCREEGSCWRPEGDNSMVSFLQVTQTITSQQWKPKTLLSIPKSRNQV